MRVIHWLKRVPLVGMPVVRMIQLCCAKLTGHKPGSDWGWAPDSKSADCWCKYCDKMYPISLRELAKNGDARRTILDVTNKDIWGG